MARRRKNILLSMNAQEKKFVRKIEAALKLEGVPREELPEQKREALEIFRQKRQKKCSRIVHDLIDEMVADEKANGIHKKGE